MKERKKSRKLEKDKHDLKRGNRSHTTDKKGPKQSQRTKPGAQNTSKIPKPQKIQNPTKPPKPLQTISKATKLLLLHLIAPLPTPTTQSSTSFYFFENDTIAINLKEQINIELSQDDINYIDVDKYSSGNLRSLSPALVQQYIEFPTGSPLQGLRIKFQDIHIFSADKIISDVGDLQKNFTLYGSFTDPRGNGSNTTGRDVYLGEIQIKHEYWDRVFFVPIGRLQDVIEVKKPIHSGLCRHSFKAKHPKNNSKEYDRVFLCYTVHEAPADNGDDGGQSQLQEASGDTFEADSESGNPYFFENFMESGKSKNSKNEKKVAKIIERRALEASPDPLNSPEPLGMGQLGAKIPEANISVYFIRDRNLSNKSSPKIKPDIKISLFEANYECRTSILSIPFKMNTESGKVELRRIVTGYIQTISSAYVNTDCSLSRKVFFYRPETLTEKSKSALFDIEKIKDRGDDKTSFYPEKDIYLVGAGSLVTGAKKDKVYLYQVFRKIEAFNDAQKQPKYRHFVQDSPPFVCMIEASNIMPEFTDKAGRVVDPCTTNGTLFWLAQGQNDFLFCDITGFNYVIYYIPPIDQSNPHMFKLCEMNLQDDKKPTEMTNLLEFRKCQEIYSIPSKSNSIYNDNHYIVSNIVEKVKQQLYVVYWRRNDTENPVEHPHTHQIVHVLKFSTVVAKNGQIKPVLEYEKIYFLDGFREFYRLGELTDIFDSSYAFNYEDSYSSKVPKKEYGLRIFDPETDLGFMFSNPTKSTSGAPSIIRYSLSFNGARGHEIQFNILKNYFSISFDKNIAKSSNGVNSGYVDYYFRMFRYENSIHGNFLTFKSKDTSGNRQIETYNHNVVTTRFFNKTLFRDPENFAILHPVGHYLFAHRANVSIEIYRCQFFIDSVKKQNHDLNYFINLDCFFVAKEAVSRTYTIENLAESGKAILGALKGEHNGTIYYKVFRYSRYRGILTSKDFNFTKESKKKLCPESQFHISISILEQWELTLLQIITCDGHLVTYRTQKQDYQDLSNMIELVSLNLKINQKNPKTKSFACSSIRKKFDNLPRTTYIGLYQEFTNQQYSIIYVYGQLKYSQAPNETQVSATMITRNVTSRFQLNKPKNLSICVNGDWFYIFQQRPEFKSNPSLYAINPYYNSAFYIKTEDFNLKNTISLHCNDYFVMIRGSREEQAVNHTLVIMKSGKDIVNLNQRIAAMVEIPKEVSDDDISISYSDAAIYLRYVVRSGSTYVPFLVYINPDKTQVYLKFSNKTSNIINLEIKSGRTETESFNPYFNIMDQNNTFNASFIEQDGELITSKDKIDILETTATWYNIEKYFKIDGGAYQLFIANPIEKNLNKSPMTRLLGDEKNSKIQKFSEISNFFKFSKKLKISKKLKKWKNSLLSPSSFWGDNKLLLGTPQLSAGNFPTPAKIITPKNSSWIPYSNYSEIQVRERIMELDELKMMEKGGTSQASSFKFHQVRIEGNYIVGFDFHKSTSRIVIMNFSGAFLKQLYLNYFCDWMDIVTDIMNFNQTTQTALGDTIIVLRCHRHKSSVVILISIEASKQLPGYYLFKGRYIKREEEVVRIRAALNNGWFMIGLLNNQKTLSSMRLPDKVDFQSQNFYDESDPSFLKLNLNPNAEYDMEAGGNLDKESLGKSQKQLEII